MYRLLLVLSLGFTGCAVESSGSYDAETGPVAESVQSGAIAETADYSDEFLLSLDEEAFDELLDDIDQQYVSDEEGYLGERGEWMTPPPGTHSKSVYEKTDPDTTGCSATAITVAKVTSGSMTVYLRYSTSCKTNWAKATRSSNGYLAAKIQTSSYTYTNSLSSATNIYTYQSYCPTGSCTARACGRLSSGASWTCTGYY
ncbi:MAG: DUF2690 domain-containing protein [Deltaproteobacteria bacterium]|nr:DUF2690 domain-containing protein [Deltaproteobacteria bacterium]